MPKPRILVIGNSSMDLNVRTKSMPERGEKTITPYPYSFSPNGRGLFSSVAASRFGADVLFCTRLGDDSNGEKLRSLLLKEGIDTRFVVTDKKKATGLDTVITDYTGISRILSCPGANSSLTDTDVEEAYVSYPDSVLIHAEINHNLLYEAIYRANKARLPVMLDPSDANFSEFDIDALGEIEIFSPNADETYKITGIEPSCVESCLRACVKIINKIKCHFVVIKLGARGCFVFDGVYSQIIPAFECDSVDMSAVGAVFNAGLLYAYLDTRDIIKGAVYANMCASLCIGQQGGYASIPDRRLIDSFIAENKLNFN